MIVNALPHIYMADFTVDGVAGTNNWAFFDSTITNEQLYYC
jgi:hypothetical protein